MSMSGTNSTISASGMSGVSGTSTARAAEGTKASAGVIDDRRMGVADAADAASVADATVGSGVTMRAVRAASALRDAAVSGVGLGVASGVAPVPSHGTGTVGAGAAASGAVARPGVTRRAVIMGAGVLALAGLASAVSARAMGAEAAQPGGETGQGTTPPDVPGGAGGAQGAGGQPPAGGMGGADTMTFDYQGTYAGALTADGAAVTSTGETYAATDRDQNAALAQNAGTLTISGGTLTKAGDDTDGDTCNFYGCNSIALAVNEGSAIYLDDTALSATSEGSNGVFATDGATVYATSISISTTAGNSRGLDATYGGTIVASDVDIATQGDHCAGVANDRGGGYVSLTDATISTAGSGSPLLYSTGSIQVNNVTGSATGSQIAGMEGLNTILIANSTLESTITQATASDPIADGVIVYQSMSGDAEATTGEAATFQVASSTLRSAIASGAMFYFTNTTANALLTNTTLDFDADAADLIRVAGNDANNWGTNGSNGATVNFTGLSQTLAGDVVADTTSMLNLYLLEGSTWSGSASVETNAAASTVDAPLNVFVDATSTWVVTADAQVSTLHVASGGQVVDETGATVTVVAAGATAVVGTGARTVAVAGAYDDVVQTTSTNELSDDLIDRTAFDQHFGLSTAFTLSGTAA
ncbi:adhesin [bacterium]|nr:adhesin [bacterium]